MKKLTVFTPTYNRAHLLPVLYASLCRQTNKDFLWLIIDDGSKDDTETFVRAWQVENKIPIEYYKKENGGIHTAYNIGIEKCDTELFICIDSDDFPPDNAVELILDVWKKKGSKDVAGIIGQDFVIDGESVGGELPNVEKVSILDLETKYGYRGDIKMVHRTELLKEVAPMRIFKNEKNFNPIYLFLKIDQKFPMLVLNENLCFVDYQPDGMANNILKQYLNSPNSFAELRLMNMSMPGAPFSFVFRHAVHYISSAILARKTDWLSKSPHKVPVILAIPFGVLLTIYLKIKVKSN
ncbi:hypothetical protein CBW16_03615 [Flavobacteriaceae bacterium JJC]|nr:hypothetical protein CBW16_03615 [Flavobacteriaceae bacterium JJC]